MKNKFNCSTCLGMQYDLLNGMYFDSKEETDDYVLCSSKIMDDTFWNMAYIKNMLNKDVLFEIENKFKAINRNSCIYIGRDDKYYLDNKEFVINNNYHLNDNDVYMILDDYKAVDINMNIKVVESDEEYNDFMKVLSSAYNDHIENSTENVYADAVTECYYEAIKMSIGNGKTYHIIGFNNDNIPVSVATLNIFNNIGIINNVGTSQGHWNKGYSKQVLSYLIRLFREHDGVYLTLCTEYHSKNQAYYEKLGFKELYVMEQYIN